MAISNAKIGVGVQQLSNANALQVDRDAKAALDELAKSFPPGLTYVIPFDTTTVVGDSISEVVSTLGAAIVIVIAVIFLFLLDWRATIIPAVTIPVSLIGTFAFYWSFDFSINTLTMFGITLATEAWWSTTPLWSSRTCSATSRPSTAIRIKPRRRQWER